MGGSPIHVIAMPGHGDREPDGSPESSAQWTDARILRSTNRLQPAPAEPEVTDK